LGNLALEVINQMNLDAQMDLLLNPGNSKDTDRRKKIQFCNEKSDCLGNISEQTFDNFLVSPSNYSVVKIIKSICESPGEDFPLIYIVGKSGLGKTHLIHASYKELSKKSSVYFSSGRDFFEFYQEQCKKFGHGKTLRDFVNAFNILILDDIEEVYQEKDFQSYFCHLYNHFSFRKKQIILSGFTSPKDLIDTAPKFYSRINSALIQEICPMDNQLAASYLDKISQDNKISLNHEMKKEMLKNFENDGRSLKSAITSFKASNLISNDSFAPPPVPLDIPLDDQVVKNISRDFQLGEAELYSPSRKKELIPARHLAMYLLHTVLGISFFQVGKKFNRDHTSVIYAVSKIEEKMKVDQKFSQTIETISNSIKNKSYFSEKVETILYH
jgi:chromosomal replication initiator protein